MCVCSVAQVLTKIKAVAMGSVGVEVSVCDCSKAPLLWVGLHCWLHSLHSPSLLYSQSPLYWGVAQGPDMASHLVSCVFSPSEHRGNRPPLLW